MPSEQTRNTIVGFTVIAAIAVFALGLSFLKIIPTFFSKAKTYEIRVEVANTGGANTGTRVTLNGLMIGSVKSVQLVNKNSATTPANAAMTNLPVLYARLVIELGYDNDIPNGTSVTVSGGSFGLGGASVSLNPPAKSDGTLLPKDGSAVLYAAPADSSFLPKEVFDDLHAMKENLNTVSTEIAEASKKIGTVAVDLHELLSVRQLNKEGNPVPINGMPAENIFTLVYKLNKSIDYANGILSDPKLPGYISTLAKNLAEQSNELADVLKTIKTAFSETQNKFGTAADTFTATLKSAEPAIANISTAAATANKTLETAQQRIVTISENLSHTLKNLDASITAITNGDGTTGKLVKDSKLYDGLVDLTNNLKATTDDINRLIHQWRQDGVPLKVGIGGK